MLTTEKKKYTDKDYSMLEEGAPFQLIHYNLIIRHQQMLFIKEYPLSYL